MSLSPNQIELKELIGAGALDTNTWLKNVMLDMCSKHLGTSKQIAFVERSLQEARRNINQEQQQENDLPYHQVIANRASKAPSSPVTASVNVMPILALLGVASAHLKYPKIGFKSDSSWEFNLRIKFVKSDKCSKCKGTGTWVNPNRSSDRRDCFGCQGSGVSSLAGGAWIDTGSGTQSIGRILPDGTLKMNQADTQEEQFIVSYSDDPKATMKNYGALTGNCCFCSKRLTDSRSTDVGYGPDCAEHYGLNWGNEIRMYAPISPLDPSVQDWRLTEPMEEDFMFVTH